MLEVQFVRIHDSSNTDASGWQPTWPDFIRYWRFETPSINIGQVVKIKASEFDKLGMRLKSQHSYELYLKVKTVLSSVNMVHVASK